MLFYASFAICMQGFVLTSDKDNSTRVLTSDKDNSTRVLTSDKDNSTGLLEESVIITNPGLIFQPISNRTEDGSLISYDAKNATSIRKWTALLNEYLEVYKTPGLTPGRGQNIYDCDYDRKPGYGHVCDVNVKYWHPCTQENNFNYHKSAPCIFLTLNKIYGWQPEFYNNTKTLPEGMPTSLVSYIERLAGDAKWERKLDTIWVSCEGESPADVENIGPIDYYPDRGFEGYFYPYMNTEGYLSPLVAVHFKQPRTGVRINVECKAWARNIIESVHFQLMID